jgi:hypothetical protein
MIASGRDIAGAGWARSSPPLSRDAHWFRLAARRRPPPQNAFALEMPYALSPSTMALMRPDISFDDLSTLLAGGFDLRGIISG